MAAHSFNLCDLAAPGVAALHPYEPGKPISELQRELGLQEVIKLASNENPLGPSPAAIAAVQACLPELARYPDGNGFQLRQALSRRHGVAPACITLGNGSNDVLELVARAFLVPGTEAVFSQHAFLVYPIVTQAVGATARIAPAHDGSRGPAFGHDLQAMAALTGAATRVVFIANPNNPTGTWSDASSLEACIAALPERTIVVVDEAYAEYVGVADYPDTIAWVKRFPNLVVTRTFSKAYGLAGLRIGYGVSTPEVADLLNRVRQPFNVNQLAQVAALHALDDRDHLSRSVQVNREGMAALEAEFTRLGLAWIPSVGNFICLHLQRPAQPVYQGLLRRGVIVRSVANYGLPEHLRITIGTEAENRRFIVALEEVLQEGRND